jgi:hypothetical protein
MILITVKLGDSLMEENNMKMEESLFSRTFTKEEALDRKKFNLIENSDVPADSVSIKNAISKAMAQMEAELDSYAKSINK